MAAREKEHDQRMAALQTKLDRAAEAAEALVVKAAADKQTEADQKAKKQADENTRKEAASERVSLPSPLPPHQHRRRPRRPRRPPAAARPAAGTAG